VPPSIGSLVASARPSIQDSVSLIHIIFVSARHHNAVSAFLRSPIYTGSYVRVYSCIAACLPRRPVRSDRDVRDVSEDVAVDVLIVRDTDKENRSSYGLGYAGPVFDTIGFKFRTPMQHFTLSLRECICKASLY